MTCAVVALDGPAVLAVVTMEATVGREMMVMAIRNGDGDDNDMDMSDPMAHCSRLCSTIVSTTHDFVGSVLHSVLSIDELLTPHPNTISI